MSPWLSELFLSSQSDERLVALARAGHLRAFAAIVERYRQQLLMFAGHLASDRRAEDIVQQTFLNAFAALQSGAEVKHLRGWLHQVLRHTAIRISSKSQLEAELDPEMHPTAALEDVVEQSLLARNTLAEIARLPAGQRDALLATAIHGNSGAEVAAMMGVSEGSVRQLVHRARASLRTAVTAVTPYPLARWLVAARAQSGGSGIQEIALTTSAASGGGMALKVGALIASGVVATGIVSTHLPRHRAHDVVSARRASPASVIAGPSRGTNIVVASASGGGIGARGASNSTPTQPGAQRVAAQRGSISAGGSGGHSPGGPGSRAGGSRGGDSGGPNRTSGSSGGSNSGASNGSDGGSSGGSGSTSGSGSQGGSGGGGRSDSGGGSGSGGGGSDSGGGSGSGSGSGDGESSSSTPAVTPASSSGSGSDGSNSNSGSDGGS